MKAALADKVPRQRPGQAAQTQCSAIVVVARPL
jgi:hypothetical protein